MTESKAIKEFQQNIDMPFGSNISREASKLAIQALEKRTPKKVIAFERAKDFIEYVCPVCKKIIATEMIGEGYFGVHTPYCSGCGQRLYWSSVKKGEGTDETD